MIFSLKLPVLKIFIKAYLIELLISTEYPVAFRLTKGQFDAFFFFLESSNSKSLVLA